MKSLSYCSKLAATIATAVLVMLPSAIKAQSDLWIIGSAVPGGVQKLESRPNKTFNFAGSLNKGVLKIVSAENPVKGTQYVIPRLEDTYIVNNGAPLTTSTDSTKQGWIVPFQEDYFRFTVDLSNKTLTGELFKPWTEVFIVGGALECGWNAFKMIEMTQDKNDPCVWEWTGELKTRTQFEEPSRFKFTGQDNWDPKVLHPYTQDENALTSTQMRSGGEDTKWAIDKDGYYHITLDIFRLTYKAEYIGTNSRGYVTSVEEVPTSAINISVSGRSISVKSEEKMHVEIIDASGASIANSHGKNVEFSLNDNGIYIVKATTKHDKVTRKIAVK